VIGLGLQDAMQAAMPDVDPKYYPRIVERYRHHYLGQDKDLTLFEGVPRCWPTCRSRAISWPWPPARAGSAEPGLNSTGLLSIRRHALRRRDLLQAASGHAAGTDARTGPGHAPHRDDRRHHPRPADGHQRRRARAWRWSSARIRRSSCSLAPLYSPSIRELHQWLNDHA
jgi:phosphoglycolate phosphatase